MRRIGSAFVIATAVIAYACGSNDNAKKDAAVDTKTADAPADAGMDAMIHDAPPVQMGTVLTIKNYLQWCTVAVGSGGQSPAAIRMVNVTSSGPVTLTAKANGSAYALGSNMWHHTDGDGSGSGEPGTQTGSGSAAQSVATATITAGTPKCVWVCCPTTAGTGCPTADQCP